MSKIDKILPLIEKHGPEIVDYIHELVEENTEELLSELEKIKSELSELKDKLDEEQKTIPLEVNGAIVEVIEGPKGDEPSDERLKKLIKECLNNEEY